MANDAYSAGVVATALTVTAVISAVVDSGPTERMREEPTSA